MLSAGFGQWARSYVWVAGALVLLWRSQPASGQTLRLTRVESARKDEIAIDLNLESPEGQEPVALQWETRIATTEATLVEDRLTAAAAAQKAGKSVSCGVREKT